jgi:hypothetical protein
LCILLGRYSVAWSETQPTSWILLSVMVDDCHRRKTYPVVISEIRFSYIWVAYGWVVCLRSWSPSKRTRREPRMLPRNHGRALADYQRPAHSQPTSWHDLSLAIGRMTFNNSQNVNRAITMMAKATLEFGFRIFHVGNRLLAHAG